MDAELKISNVPPREELIISFRPHLKFPEVMTVPKAMELCLDYVPTLVCINEKWGGDVELFSPFELRANDISMAKGLTEEIFLEIMKTHDSQLIEKYSLSIIGDRMNMFFEVIEEDITLDDPYKKEWVLLRNKD